MMLHGLTIFKHSTLLCNIKSVVFDCILRLYLNAVQHSSLDQNEKALDGGQWAVLHPVDFLPTKEFEGCGGPTASLDAAERKINCSLSGIDSQLPDRALLPIVTLVSRGLFVSLYGLLVILGGLVATVTLLSVKCRCCLVELMCHRVRWVWLVA
jgi:hypothetical protein